MDGTMNLVMLEGPGLALINVLTQLKKVLRYPELTLEQIIRKYKFHFECRFSCSYH